MWSNFINRRMPKSVRFAILADLAWSKAGKRNFDHPLSVKFRRLGDWFENLAGANGNRECRMRQRHEIGGTG
jgi:hypothetical protein